MKVGGINQNLILQINAKIRIKGLESKGYNHREVEGDCLRIFLVGKVRGLHRNPSIPTGKRKRWKGLRKIKGNAQMKALQHPQSRIINTMQKLLNSNKNIQKLPLSIRKRTLIQFLTAIVEEKTIIAPTKLKLDQPLKSQFFPILIKNRLLLNLTLLDQPKAIKIVLI